MNDVVKGFIIGISPAIIIACIILLASTIVNNEPEYDLIAYDDVNVFISFNRFENSSISGTRILFIDVNITNIANEPKIIRPSDYHGTNSERPWYWIVNGTQINCSYFHTDGDSGPTELLLPGENYSYTFDVGVSNMFNGSMFLPLNYSFDSYDFYLAVRVHDNPYYKPSNILTFTEDELLGVPSR